MTKTPDAPKPLPINPFILFQRADIVQRWKRDNDEVIPRALLLFGKVVHRFKDELDDKCETWQIAAYECDSDGAVCNWRERFDLTVTVGDSDWAEAAYRMVLMIRNDFLPFQHIENL